MSIAPSSEDIEVEAFFDNRDVGFLERWARESSSSSTPFQQNASVLCAAA
ncbi:hypothetical protein [Sinorhizobium sp. KGO-5]